MPYASNQYNYSTPLQSSSNLTNANLLTKDNKYFTLFDNVLNGSYYPISGDVGLWGTSLADANGVLPEPFVVTVTENLSINAINIVSSSQCYPVDFTIDLYNYTTLLHTYTKSSNSTPSITCILPSTFSITHYVVTINKLSSAGVARLYNSYQSWYLMLSDSIKISSQASSKPSIYTRNSDILYVSEYSRNSNVHNTIKVSDADLISVTGSNSTVLNIIGDATDNIKIKQSTHSHINNRIDTTYDYASIRLKEDVSHVINTVSAYDSLLCNCFGALSLSSSLVNIHSAMKETTRRIFGKVYITYTDPLLDSSTMRITTSSTAYNSEPLQVIDNVTEITTRVFTLYENDLNGLYFPSSADTQVGWSSSVLSDSDGYFAVPQQLEFNFTARPIVNFTLHFDSIRENVARDFTVEIMLADGAIFVKDFVDNDNADVSVPLPTTLIEATSIRITINRISKPYYPATIVDASTTSKILYTGYQDDSNLISIDLLEELTYEDEIEALGGMSANEVTISLDNTDRQFSFNNPNSPVSGQLKRNRKVEPYLGAEVIPGEIEWYSLGTYWTFSWDVPLDSLSAKVTAFDNIGLLDITSFVNHQVLIDKSLGYLIEYVLTDAKKTLSFIKWEISEELYNVIVPYAWFEYGSHAAALRKICAAYPMHIYCDRNGTINAAPQRLHATDYHDVWSNDTNVVDKHYSSLYTTLPNLINVTVVRPLLKQDEELVSDELSFDVSTTPTRRLNFSSPYISDLVVDIDCDSTIEYTYEVYSWGIDVSFTGTGAVYHIKCYGTALDTSNTVTLSRRDEDSILRNGVVTRDISADFIQNTSTANYIMDRLFELSTYDKYDVEVNYRGDIALSINDNVLLVDGLLPSNMYTIKRHQLTWDGSLTGSADLNT